MRAEKEMGMQMQTAMEMEMGEGRKGRGFIGREVRRVPPLPSLPFFLLYISCVVKRTGTSCLKMGGRPGVGSLDGPFSSSQKAFSLLLASLHCIICVFLHRFLCRQQPCPLRPGLPIHDPSFYHSLAAWQPKSRQIDDGRLNPTQ